MEEQTKQEAPSKNLSKAPVNKGMRRLVVTSIVIALFLIGTPFGIQYGVISALKNAGSKHVELADVDFNPFSGVLALKGLSANTSIDPKHQPELKVALLSVEFDWLPLFKKQLVVNAVQLKDSSLDIHQLKDKAVKIAGLTLPAADPKKPQNKSSWGIGLGQVHLINNEFNISTPSFKTAIKIDNLALAQLISWKQGESSDVAFDASINGAHVKADLALDAFAETPTVSGSLTLDKLQLARFQPIVKETFNELEGLLSVDVKFAVELSEQGMQYKQSGTISLAQSTLGSIGLQLKQQSALWKGEVTVNKQSDKQSIQASGDITVSGVDAHNTYTDVKILQLDKAAVQGVTVDQLDKINVSTLVLEGLLLAQQASDKTALATAKNLTVNSIQLKNMRDVAIESVLLSGLIANVNIDKKGGVVVLNKLFEREENVSTTADEAEQVDTQPTPEKTQPLIKIASIKTVGENHVNLTNGRVKDAVKKEIRINKLEIGELNNEAANTLTPILLDATINKHSSLLVNGGIAPFSEKLNTNIKAKLKAFELPAFSPIIRDELGYDIQSGQLNADINIQIKQNILDGKTKLDIHGLVMQPADKEKMAKMTKQLSMPLDSALSLLRDDNDDISLKIPVKGDVAKPDFDVGDVINTALGNALQGTVKNVLKYALQPYGAIFMLASKAYEASTSISLDAIEFTAGASVLADKTKPYLERIGGLMKKRPGLRIRLCGIATPNDRVALQEQQKVTAKQVKPLTVESTKGSSVTGTMESQLQALAKARAAAIKSKLVADYKIDAARLFNCLPKVVTEPQKPRVEILI